jgi:hypothetical protein
MSPCAWGAALLLVVGVSGLMLWLAEWHPGDREIPPPERPVTPQDWRRP